MPAIAFAIRMGIIYLGGIIFSWGQASNSLQPTFTGTTTASGSFASPVTQNGSSGSSYLREQQALAKGMQNLLAGGATWQQVKAWQQQNASTLATLQQQAISMANASASHVMAAVGQPNIPVDASPALKDFLQTQATLANARAQIHNQLLQQTATPGQTLSQAQVVQMQVQEMRVFRQRYAGDLQLLAQQAQRVANASPSTLVGLPPAPVIPANAPPQMAAFLKAKYQLLLSQMQVVNQYVTAAPKVQEAAQLQWRGQNASSLTQLKQLEQNLSSGNPLPKN